MPITIEELQEKIENIQKLLKIENENPEPRKWYIEQTINILFVLQKKYKQMLKQREKGK